ncbi:MAG TPA: hypothetical protein PK619_02620 [bacterium]|mgnify:FL=1|nr:hypothetical protein [bacterium]HPN81670.1 hypothetical protein [bacterium]HPW39589.1 hypothetical protein [bacterium]
MSPEKWEQIKGQIQDVFGDDVEQTQEALAEPEVGEKETIIFNGPLGRMKLEYYTRPIVLDKRTHGSRRIGSQTAVEYIYSVDQFSHSLKVYRWDDSQDNWVEAELSSGVFSI